MQVKKRSLVVSVFIHHVQMFHQRVILILCTNFSKLRVYLYHTYGLYIHDDQLDFYFQSCRYVIQVIKHISKWELESVICNYTPAEMVLFVCPVQIEPYIFSILKKHQLSCIVKQKKEEVFKKPLVV